MIDRVTPFDVALFGSPSNSCHLYSYSPAVRSADSRATRNRRCPLRTHGRGWAHGLFHTFRPDAAKRDEARDTGVKRAHYAKAHLVAVDYRAGRARHGAPQRIENDSGHLKIPCNTHATIERRCGDVRGRGVASLSERVARPRGSSSP